MKITVALLQLVSHGADVQLNLQKGEDYFRRAAALGADIVLFPEMWSVGYTLPEPGDPAALAAWQALALDDGSPFLTRFQALAREVDCAAAVTFLQQWPGAPRNAVSLIDRRGRVCFTYAKVHTCSFDREAALTPGEAFYTGELDTRAGPVQVGAMICFDREFPESARILMLQGAEIVLIPNACEMEMQRSGQLRARAYENMLALALANYAAPQELGHSQAYDPIAFTPAGSSRDNLAAEAGSEEGITLAVFDLEAIRAYRAREVWGNAYRRPACYGLLTDPEVQPPFTRPTARR